MAKTKLLALGLAFMLALALTACGSDPVDDMIVDYEKFIVEVENLAKKDSVSMDDLNNLMKKLQEFSDKNQKLVGADARPSEAQTKKIADLTSRMMTAMQQVQMKAR